MYPIDSVTVGIRQREYSSYYLMIFLKFSTLLKKKRH